MKNRRLLRILGRLKYYVQTELIQSNLASLEKTACILKSRINDLKKCSFHKTVLRKVIHFEPSTARWHYSVGLWLSYSTVWCSLLRACDTTVIYKVKKAADRHSRSGTNKKNSKRSDSYGKSNWAAKTEVISLRYTVPIDCVLSPTPVLDKMIVVKSMWFSHTIWVSCVAT